MLTKISIITVLTFSFSALQASNQPEPRSNPSKTQNQSPRQKAPDDKIIYVPMEPDQTDIFAIPLDEDDFDQQRELYELEHPRSSKNQKTYPY
jgi:hypothetical protein